MLPASWLTVCRGDTPLIVSLPHAGTDIPSAIEARLSSNWLGRKDADWWLDHLYGFAADLGATIVKTSISRTVIDVNRDPSGVSLYPGQTTTALCPTETFDGEPLYTPGGEPNATEIADRRQRFYEPYHTALISEIARLHGPHPRVVLYDGHSIRSVLPRLFDGELPQINIGTNRGASCDAHLAHRVEAICVQSGVSHVTDGRFIGGYITRHYGRPRDGIHAIQVELASRGYMREPLGTVSESDWPPPYRAADAEALASVLRRVLASCIDFAVQVPPRQ